MAVEAKAIKRPLEELVVEPQLAVELPQLEMLDSLLAPSAGVIPSGVDTKVVKPTQVLSVSPMLVTQVLRSKISEAPRGLGAVAPRFVARDVKETNRPVFEIDGFELAPLPCVAPSGVETSIVVGTQVLVFVAVEMSQVLRM